MKKKLLCTIAAVSAVACFTAGVYASVKLETISAYLNHGISIAKGGEIVTLLDSDGNKMTPITYNDSTYLPVRALSNLLGHDIDWDAETQCVLIDNSAVPESLKVVEQKPQNDIIIPDITDGKMEIDYIYKLIDKVGNGRLDFDYFDMSSLPPGVVTAQSHVTDGVWHGYPVYMSEEWGVAYAYSGADVVTVDGAPADEIETFYNAFCDTLIANGYNLVYTDETGAGHYVKGKAEFEIKNIDNKVFSIYATTTYMSCHAEGSN